MTQYSLYWLRELPGGALGGEYGTVASTLAELPINETLAGRIHALSPPGVAVSLHFPFLSNRDRKDWPTRQLQLPVTAQQPGWIDVGDPAARQFASLLAGLAVPTQSPAPYLFHEEHVWKASAFQTAVLPMLAAHRIRVPPGWRPTGPLRLRWTIQLPPEHTGGWAAMPDRHDSRFLDQLRGMSTAVQQALRLWMPFIYFRDCQRFAKPRFAHAYLVYSLLPPHPSRRKNQLTFHVLEPQRVVRTMSRLRRPLTGRLRRELVRMEAEGFEARTAYQPGEALSILRSMRALPPAFGALVSLEAFVVEELVRFASAALKLRQGPRKARALTRPGIALLHNLRCRLARSYGGESYPDLVNLILVAATAGLAWRNAPDEALIARVSVTDLENGRGFDAESRFSYANS